MTSRRVPLVALALSFGITALAVNSKFSDMTPLTRSAGPLPVDGDEEATPITLSNPKWSQRTLADRRTQNSLVMNSNSGNWDMITSNLTGPNAGRYLFMPFETGTAGVRIFLDAKDAREIARGRPTHLDCVETEADARIWDVLAKVLLRARQQHWTGLAVVEGGKKLKRLRIDTGLGLVRT